MRPAALSFLALAVLVLAPLPAEAATLKGRVLYQGPVPEPLKAKLGVDPVCRSRHPNGLEHQDVVVSDGGLEHVLVHLKSGVRGTFPPPPAAVVLDQSGCRYSPSLLALQAGQTLKIRNSDPTLHNVHLRPKLNPEINIGQPREGMESSRVLAKPEVLIPIGCDVHPWMRASLAVLSHPFFAVTTGGGAFEITGVPPGTYEVEAVHPKLAAVTVQVVVDTGDVDLSLTLQP